MRWLIRLLLGALVLAFLAGAALILIPGEKIAGLAAARFAEITGRSLQIEGAVRPSIWPVLGVQTGAVTISNADWSDAGPMLRAQSLSISLDMAALIAGDVRITGIRAEAPEVILERARDGRENWVFGGASGGTATPGMAGEGTPFTLDLAEIEAGSFTFIDHGTGSRSNLTAIDGTLRIPAFAGKAEVDFRALHQGQAFAARAVIAEFAPFLEGRVVGLDASLTAGDAKVAFAGRAGWNPMSADGEVTADLADLAAITRLAGVARPDLPQGLGARAVTVKGRMTLTDTASLHLRGGVVGLDTNRLSVEADLTTAGERPKLSAQVSAGALSLAQAPGGQGGAIGGGARGGAEAAGWPTDQIDVSALGLMDASVALTADSVDLGLARLGATRLLLTNDRGRAVFDLRQIAVYQGTVTGQFVVNSRGGLSVGGDLRLSDLAMQPLLTDLGGFDRLIGTGDLTLKFLGVGASVDAIARSLSGSGKVSLGKGELRGLDIAGMLRTLDAGFVGAGQKTIFDAITASFVIDRGVLSNDDLAFKAPYVTATGAGRIGIGARTLDYRLRPTALAAVDGSGGVMVPLLISGTWANPKFRLDMESLAREQFEDEAKALEARARAEAKAAEARAKAEVEQKLQDELGITRQEGESLEDAARRGAQQALEQEAARALNRLLGGN
ncbi:MAG: AsmA family protein [Rhodobacteraceae bacterium]|nr:AsmA family protein [Paracoccaceae bacterium]